MIYLFRAMPLQLLYAGQGSMLIIQCEPALHKTHAKDLLPSRVSPQALCVSYGLGT